MARAKLYLAAPLFNPSEREYNRSLRALLNGRFDVYLPQDDGELLPNLLAAGHSHEIATKRIFKADVTAIQACHVFLIVLNGRTVDEGAAFELGVAWSCGKPCYGFKDDFRQLISSGDNPMIERALTSVFKSVDSLEQWAHQFQIVNPHQ